MALWLFLALSGFYALFTSGHLDTPDGLVMFHVTRAIVTDGSLSFPSLERVVALAGPPARPGPRGEERQYGKYGLGLSLAAVPAYVASRVLLPLATARERRIFLTPHIVEGLMNRGSLQPVEWHDRRALRVLPYDVAPERFEQAFGALCVSWTNAWIAAAIAAVALLLLLEVGVGLRAALATALALALASPLWHYATVFFAEPLVALLVMAASLHLVRHRRSGRAAHLLLAGLFLGAVGLTKIALLALALPVLAALALGWRGRRPAAAAKELAWIGLGMLPPLALVVVYNLIRFHAPLETGYGEEAGAWSTPFFVGLRGLLLSPGRGALWYCPALIAGFAFLPRLWRRSREAALIAGLSLPVLALLYARWWLWEGGWCWGPRFLLPGLPLALLPLAAFFLGEGRAFLRRLTAGLMGLSALIALSALLVNFADFYAWMRRYAQAHAEVLAARGYENYYGLLRWEWDCSPLIAYWSFPVRNHPLVASAIGSPGVILGLFTLAAIAAVVGARQVYKLARSADGG